MVNRKTSISDDYISGFTDGEGCFGLSVRRDVRHERASKAVYYSWKAIFAISLRADDFKILEEFKKRFEVGEISFTKNNKSVRYQVTDLFELQDTIIPFFRKNKLFGKKKRDFKLWAEAVSILLKYKKIRGSVNIVKGSMGFQKVVWSKEDLARIQEIQEQSSKFKSSQNRKWTNSRLGREEV